MKISSFLLPLVKVGSSKPVRNPSLLPFLKAILKSLTQNLRLIQSFDVQALLNSLLPQTWKTFKDYALLVVLPTIEAQYTKYQRTDCVWCLQAIKFARRDKDKERTWSQIQGDKQGQNPLKLAELPERQCQQNWAGQLPGSEDYTDIYIQHSHCNQKKWCC